MEKEYYNYNNEQLLTLNNEDVTNNISLIDTIFKDYEILQGEVIIHELTPLLVINGYKIARIKNNITEPKKLSYLEINENDIYAYI